MAGRYKIKSISELTGFSPTLLRAWERRHQLLDPVRQPSGHRLYTDDDLAVLRQVKILIEQGHSIGEIAARGRELLLEAGRGRPLAFEVRGEIPGLPGHSDGELIDELRKEIVAGALELNTGRVILAIERAEAQLATQDLLYGLLQVTAREVGLLWANGKATVASEHLLSGIWSIRLRAWTERDAAEIKPGKGPVFCAAFPDELHELGLLHLVYELRRLGREVTFLGACLPFEDLERAVAKIHPRSVCLSVTRQPVYEVHRSRFSELVARHRQVQFVLGGSGVSNLESELTVMGVIPWPPYRSLQDLEEVLP